MDLQKRSTISGGMMSLEATVRYQYMVRGLAGTHDIVANRLERTKVSARTERGSIDRQLRRMVGRREDSWTNLVAYCAAW